jgi:TP901 family phage tail tape measure protein
MSANENLGIEITASVNNLDKVERLAAALDGSSGSAGKLGRELASEAAKQREANKEAALAVDVHRKLAAAIEAQNKAEKAQQSAQTKMVRSVRQPSTSDATLGKRVSEFDSSSRALDNARAQVQELQRVASRVTFKELNDSSERAGINLANIRRNISGVGETIKRTRADNVAIADLTRRQAESYDPMVRKSAEVTRQTERMRTEMARVREEAGYTGDSVAGLASSRYALYDVSNTLTMMSAAMAAASLGPVALAAKWEHAMADVSRTSGLGTYAAEGLERSMLSLVTEIPKTIEGITAIGTLAGQMGVAGSEIDDFTATVSKFSALSNVAPAQAAEQIGRVAQLAGVSAENYENLAAAVYETGVNAVATEGMILSVMKELSSVSTAYGLAAQDVTALSSAFASLGVSPELARGSLQRVFAALDKSVVTGGTRLKDFAITAGMTSEEFAEAWRGDPMTAFSSFVDGMGAAVDRGANVNVMLSDLGINSTRDAQALMKLSQNMDVLRAAQEDVATGWSMSGRFSEDYAKKSSTLISELLKLANAVKVSFAGISIGWVSKIVRGVTTLVKAFGQLLQNPVVGFITTIGVGFAAVSAGLLFFGAMAARTNASLLALVFLIRENSGELQEMGLSTFSTASIMRLLRTELDATSLSMGRMGVAARATSGAGAMVRGAFSSALFSGITAGFAAATIAATYFYQKHKDNQNSIKALSESLRVAMDLDTKNKDFSVGRIEAQINAVSKSEKETIKAKDAQLTMNAAISGSSTAYQKSTDAVKEYTLALGENYKQAVKNKFMNPDENNDGDKRFVKLRDLWAQYIERYQQNPSWAGDVNTLIDQIAGGPEDLEAARKRIEELKTLAYKSNTEYKLTPGYNGGYVSPQALEEIHQLETFLKIIDDLEKAQAKQGFGAFVQKQLEGLDPKKQAEAAKLAVLGVEELANSNNLLASSFMETQHAMGGALTSMNELGASVRENGTSFDELSVGGRANIEALRSSLEETAKAVGGADTQAFAEHVVGVAHGLSAIGVNSSKLLDPMIRSMFEAVAVTKFVRNEMVASMHGVFIADQMLKVQRTNWVNAQMTKLSKSGTNASNAVRYGFNNAGKAIDNAGDSAKKAEKKIRTLSNYVSDLKSVFGKAFEFRFGFDIARDNTVQAFSTIQKSIRDAKSELDDLIMANRELRDELSQLAADRNILEYQLSVAIEYGDSLREADIRAELDKNATDAQKAQNKLTENTEKMGDAQRTASFEMSGMSDEAIKNREQVLSLVKAYEDQVAAYANTGASKKQVAAYAETLRKQLDAQLRSLGLTTKEAKKYSDALRDVRNIVNSVPRNLTVKMTANTDAATKALREFRAENVKNTSATHTQKTNYVTSGKPPAAPNAKSLALEALRSQLSVLNKMASYTKGLAAFTPINIAITAIRNEIKKLTGYQSGGYTGRGRDNEVAGVVHKNEYVIDAERVRQLGVPFLNSLGSTTERPAQTRIAPVGVSVSGPSVQRVELSPYDRQLLEQVGNMGFYLDGKKVANAVNASNRTVSVRGGM